MLDQVRKTTEHDQLISKIAKRLYDEYFRIKPQHDVRGRGRTPWRNLPEDRRVVYVHQAEIVLHTLLGPGRWRRVAWPKAQGHVSFYALDQG